MLPHPSNCSMVRPEKWPRRLLGVFALGNLLALTGIFLWSPAVGLDVFNFDHARFAVAALMATVIAFAISIVGLAWRRGIIRALWLVVAVQVLRVIPVVAAVSVWPGGDDGPMIAWTGIVLPITVVLAVCGLVAAAMILSRRRAPPAAGEISTCLLKD